MRLLTNENIGKTAVALLRASNHDVLSVKESMSGSTDEEILQRAVAEQRVVVTFDKDFGELAFRARLPATCGVILFRFAQRGREADASRIAQVISSRTDWAGAFWIVTESQIKRRSLPE